MKSYCETGFTNTRQHGSAPTGRGQRKTKKNQRFLESGDDEETNLKEKVFSGFVLQLNLWGTTIFSYTVCGLHIGLHSIYVD